MANYLTGDQLSPRVQAQCLARFVNRYTKEHTPNWVDRSGGHIYPVQFASDAEWLANTSFAVTATGELDKRVIFCESRPTWPEGNVLKTIENMRSAGK